MCAVWALVLVLCLSCFCCFCFGFSMFAVWALVSMICLSWVWCFYFWFLYLCSLGFGFNDHPELVSVAFSFGFRMFAACSRAADWQGEPLAWRVLGRMGAACHGRGADVVVRVRLHLRTPLPQSDGVPQAGFEGRSRIFISLGLPPLARVPYVPSTSYPNVRSRFCFQRPESSRYYK